LASKNAIFHGEISGMRPYLMAFSLNVLFVFAATPPAHAWGCKGHQAVAYIAAKHLTPEARELVLRLLSENPIDPELKRYCGNVLSDLMVDASTWPDDVRDDRKNGSWHYIDIPRGKHKGVLDDYCGNYGCVTRAIEEQRSILNDKLAAPQKRAEAIRYLIHFLGDLHQPLHAISNGDIGGTCVPVKYLDYDPLPNLTHPEREEYSPNLHQVWDTEILERTMEISNTRRYADELDKRFKAEAAPLEAAGIHIEAWAWESHERGETWVYDALRTKIDVQIERNPKNCADDHVGNRMFAKHVVADEAYQRNSGKAVEDAIAQAGVRLAMILNDAAKATP
jgi:hypothetical protein